MKLVILLLALIMVACSVNQTSTITKQDCSNYEATTVPSEWLIERVSITEVDKYFEGHSSDCMKGLWQEIRTGLKPKDEVWRFSSPDEQWLQLMGRGGFVIVSSGIPGNAIVTVLN